MSHILRYIFVIAVAYDGRRLGAGKVTLKASLSSARFLSEPHRPPHHHVHAADRGPGAGLEFARGILDGGDEALRISAFPAFINMVHEIRLVRLSTSNIAFLAIGLFGKRSWRGAGPFHQGH